MAFLDPKHLQKARICKFHNGNDDCTIAKGSIAPFAPSADEYDLRPIPDDNSASMQSYNHSQTVIWPQEHTYGHIIPHLSIGVGVNPTKARSPPREVFSKADAATPFGTESHLLATCHVHGYIQSGFIYTCYA